MEKIFVEENGRYCIDCTNALWATDQMNIEYHKAGIHISDVDFVMENITHIFLVEYKNAMISGASNPAAFNPMADKRILTATRKFYDSLHFLHLLGKDKPIQYIYVLEYPNGDTTTRKRLRNRLRTELPFVLQENIGNGKKLIDKVDVVSIKEWNENEVYGQYPIIMLENNSCSTS